MKRLLGTPKSLIDIFFSLHRHHTRRAHLIVVAGAKYAVGVPVLVHVPRVVIPAARAEHDLHLHVLVPEHEFGRLVRIAAIGSTLEDLGGGRWLKRKASDYSRDIDGQEGAELLVTVQRSHSILLTCSISLKSRVLCFLIFLKVV